MTTSSVYLSSQLLIGEQLKRGTHATPDNEIFVFSEKRYTYKELDERATHLAGWLQGIGVDHDDKVGYILENSPEFVETFYGVALTGGVGVPINYRLSAEEFAYIINNSDSKVLIVDESYAEAIQSVRNQMPNVKTIIVTGNTAFDGMIPYDSIFEENVMYEPCDLLEDDDPGLICYTSGTTGRPKGAVITHKAVVFNGLNLNYEGNTRPGSISLVVTPLFHISVITGLVGLPSTGGKMVVQRQYDPQAVLRAITEEKVTSLFLVPTMWNMLLSQKNINDFDLTSMEKCLTGASVCPLELKNKIMKYFPNAGIFDGFGQTETASAATMLKPEDSLVKTSSVGKALSNIEIRVVDENMNDVPVGEIGEIVYRGPNLLKEYYKNPEATAEAFQGGWFHSGDLVRLDEDGFVYVVDRKNDMIISGGENVYPTEVEEVLFTHPKIYEVSVVGIPDEHWGERVKAFVVLKPGMEATAEEIMNYCATKIASYKKPREVEFIDVLPRNAAGKVLRRQLRERSTTTN